MYSSLENVFSKIKSGARIVTSMGASEPRAFFENFHTVGKKLEDITVHCANPSRDYPCFSSQDLLGKVDFEVMFLTACVRKEQGRGLIHYVPQHLSQWSKNLLERGPVDIFWGSCTPPNDRGIVSLGPNCCYESEVIARAKTVVLEVNHSMPRTFGETQLSLAPHFYLIENDHALPVLAPENSTANDLIIGQYVADLISNESTLQLGIGSIPNAIGIALRGKKDLGIHTELITECMMDLMKAGVVTNSKKSLRPGKAVGSFVFGSKALYEFVNENQDIELLPSSYVNDPYVIGKNSKMVSVNSAVEVDLTGQVCSESIGHREISGVGGASDTHTGAQRSDGGRSIIALHSTTADFSNSKIVSELKPGAKISISRNDIDTIVTEYGVAKLKGNSVAQRVKAMISLAHPKFREQLLADAKKNGYL